MQDFSDSYAVLGLPLDADWETVRARYRRLIGQWHPDRFSADAVEQKYAETRSKQITTAYQALEHFHRTYGVLPGLVDRAGPLEPREPVRDTPPASHRAGTRDRPEAGAANAAVREAARPRRRGRRVAVALFALIAMLFLGYRYLDPWARDDSGLEDGAGNPDVAQPAPQVARRSRDRRGISTGSTVGDVYAIQGIPTLTQGDIWYYGKSQIHFAQGVVVSWNESPDNPLRIARNQPVVLQDGHFKLGSTKDEVRATQGTPVTETATVWDYGLSRVYFEQNRVVRWEESPMQPLRVPH